MAVYPILALLAYNIDQLVPWNALRSLLVSLARVSSKNARMTIFNAYYLPGGGKELLYGTITPVNTFRLILDHYFGTNLGLLDDSSYYYDEDSRSYPLVLDKRKLCEGSVE